MTCEFWVLAIRATMCARISEPSSTRAARPSCGQAMGPSSLSMILAVASQERCGDCWEGMEHTSEGEPTIRSRARLVSRADTNRAVERGHDQLDRGTFRGSPMHH